MMDYSLYDCSLYTKRNLSGKEVFIFDKHNMALPVWGSFAALNRCSYNLITFDTHTDTHPPFISYLCEKGYNGLKPYGKEALDNPIIAGLLSQFQYSVNQFDFEEVYKLSCNFVKHDEQIQTACAMDYLQSYMVIHRSEAGGFEEFDRQKNLLATYINASDINKTIIENVQLPIALDFDLDFFRNRDDLNEAFFDCISFAIKKASFITIAREVDYFEKCKDDERFFNDKALELLLNGIDRILKLEE